MYMSKVRETSCTEPKIERAREDTNGSKNGSMMASAVSGDAQSSSGFLLVIVF
jgi:hypothetical protein